MQKLSALGIGILFSSACSFTPQLAPELNVPNKPLLKKEIVFLTYNAEQSPLKIKSVQLPAHPIHQSDKVRIDSKSLQLTGEQKHNLETLLTEKGLIGTDNNNADYVLTVQQLSVNKQPDLELPLIKPQDQTQQKAANLAKANSSIACANSEVKISFRLNHRKSADVVWISQAGLSSHTYINQPVVYKFTQQQIVTNEQNILDFVRKQNTEEARKERFDKVVTIPQYQIGYNTSPLTKVSGICSAQQVSSITSEIETHLITELIAKLKVQ